MKQTAQQKAGIGSPFSVICRHQNLNEPEAIRLMIMYEFDEGGFACCLWDKQGNPFDKKHANGLKIGNEK